MELAHKDLNGREENKSLYDIEVSVPKIMARFQLSKNQRYWFKWFASEFVKTKRFSKLDQIHLQKAAFWLDARCEAFKIINEENKSGDLSGMVQKFKSGATNITGWMSIVKDADKSLDDISAHFGLSIRDRKKLSSDVSVDPDQYDMFADFNSKKHG